MNTKAIAVAVAVVASLLAGCQGHSAGSGAVSQIEGQNFNPKPLPPAELAQKMDALEARRAEYIKKHPLLQQNIPGNVSPVPPK